MSNQATHAAPQEIERKFLVTATPPEFTEHYAGRAILQGYLVIGADGSEVRLRDNQGEYTQTVKTDGELVRGEWEVPLTAEQFNVLWPATADKRVEKTRYTIPSGEHTIELDVFKGQLAGLVMAEVEFADQKDAAEFAIPEWFGVEVTTDKRYKNKNLAVNGLPV